MACGTTLCILKPLLAVAAVAAVGMGGYNLATDGCILGSCGSKESNTTLTSHSDAKQPESGCCASKRDAEPTAMLASQESAEPQGCPEAMKAACEAMGECPPGMMAHCEGEAGECPMGGGATASLLVAETTEGAACDAKSECEKACDGQAKTAGQTECETECQTECQTKSEQTAEAEAQTESAEG